MADFYVDRRTDTQTDRDKMKKIGPVRYSFVTYAYVHTDKCTYVTLCVQPL